MKNYLIYILFCLTSISLIAKNTIDTVLLPSVHLNETRVQTHNTGAHIEKLDPKFISLSKSYSLSDLLNNYSSIYIKQYGALSTPSFRGTSSSQTIVKWNGIVLNSTANGLLDFSILPVGSFDETYIVHGGDASVFGSGAMGGSIHCNTVPKFNNKSNIIVTLDRGSYGLNGKALSFSHSKDNIALSIFLNHITDENNFKYVNTSQLYSPLQVSNYGKLKSNQKLINFSYKFNNSIVKLNYWGTESDREVPQNMTTLNSDSKQYDIYDRFLISSAFSLNLFKIQFKQAYIKEDFNYTELSKDINSFFIAESYISDLNLKYTKKNLILNIGSIFSNNLIENNNYGGIYKAEKNLAVFSAIQFDTDKLKISTVLRKEWHDVYLVPFIPSLALEYKVYKDLKVRGRINVNFRLPSFNDRYWQSGNAYGNNDLSSENSISREVGIDYAKSNYRFYSTIYFMNISDMISWQTLDNGDWTPQNIQKVKSNGIESGFSVNLNKISLKANYCFTKSISDYSASEFDVSTGKQLRYVPLNKLNLILDFNFKEIHFIFDHSFTDKVITNYGYENDRYLDSYLISNLTAKTKIKLLPINIEFKVKNLMNKSYQTYENYPNPGREFLCTINYTIN